MAEAEVWRSENPEQHTRRQLAAAAYMLEVHAHREPGATHATANIGPATHGDLLAGLLFLAEAWGRDVFGENYRTALRDLQMTAEVGEAARAG